MQPDQWSFCKALVFAHESLKKDKEIVMEVEALGWRALGDSAPG